MARATYVYVVELGDRVLAGFTVKRELVNWLKRRRNEPGWQAGLVVTRVSDGGDGPERNTVMKLDELLAEQTKGGE